MGKHDKRIEELDECPHCGSDLGSYRRFYLCGWTQDNTTFDGEKYNHHMYDPLKDSRWSKWHYCIQCNKKLAREAEEKNS